MSVLEEKYMDSALMIDWSDAAKEDRSRIISELCDAVSDYPEEMRNKILTAFLSSTYFIAPMENEVYNAIIRETKKTALDLIEPNLKVLHTKYGHYIFVKVEGRRIRIVRIIADTEPYIVINKNLIEQGVIDLEK